MREREREKLLHLKSQMNIQTKQLSFNNYLCTRVWGWLGKEETCREPILVCITVGEYRTQCWDRPVHPSSHSPTDRDYPAVSESEPDHRITLSSTAMIKPLRLSTVD